MVAFFPHATLDLTSGMGIVSSNHNNLVVTLNENQIENLMIYVGFQSFGYPKRFK